MAADELNGAERKELAEMIDASARSLLKLVQGAVELCAFQAGRATLNRRSVDLRALIERLCQELEPRVEEKTIVLGLEGSGPFRVAGDERRLEHALLTILENAIHHGYPVSCVEIRIDRAVHDIVIEIENEGEIIAEEDHPFVFDAFRVRDASHHSKGVGVDLALAREIALAHGGNLECRATSEHSMVFTMTLPVSVADKAPPAATDDEARSTPVSTAPGDVPR
jgi:signal transduction histidine kinase